MMKVIATTDALSSTSIRLGLLRQIGPRVRSENSTKTSVRMLAKNQVLWNSASAARKPSRKITKMMMSNRELTSPNTIM